jgi:hypothetical protein
MRGASSSVAVLGALVMIAAVLICLLTFLRCPRRPVFPKVVCLVLFLFSLYAAVDWIVNWAGF